MRNMLFDVKHKIRWVGDYPKNTAVIDGEGYVKDGGIFQDVITDPVKGHLWDLKRNKCLVHPVCDCKLYVTTHVTFSLFGRVSEVQKQMMPILEARDKLERQI